MFELEGAPGDVYSIGITGPRGEKMSFTAGGNIKIIVASIALLLVLGAMLSNFVG